MPAQPISPPLNKPVRDLARSPNHKDGNYWELVSRQSVAFQANSPIKRGTPYSTIQGAKQSVIDAHPTGLYFCQEIVPLRSSDVGGMPGDLLVIWVWQTDQPAQSATNAAITYSGDAVAYPIYVRDSIIRRETYQTTPTIATNSALTALIGVTITAGGTGYTTATGTVGTATVEFVCSGGAIIAGIVTSEGSGITSGAAITITGNTGAAGATATAVIQPAGAVLVKQEKVELGDSPLAHEFVQVRRFYETLPGPYIPFTRYDENLGPIQGRRRAVLATTPVQAASLSATAKKTYEGREGSSVVLWEIEESWSDGTGGAGNPEYPERISDPYDDVRGTVSITRQYSTTRAASTKNTALGVETVIEYEATDNPALWDKVTTVTTLFSAEFYEKALPETTPSEFRGETSITSIRSAGIAASPTLSGDVRRQSERQVTVTDKVVETEERSDSSGPQAGNETERTTNVTHKYTIERVNNPVDDAALLADPLVTHTPISPTKVLKRTDIVPTAAFDAVWKARDTKINLQIPPVLESIDVVWNKDVGTGSGSGIGAQGTIYSGGFKASAEAHSSGGVQPALNIVISRIWGNNLPTTSYFFLMAGDTITQAEIIARFAALASPLTILPWPVFKPKTRTLVAKGMKISLRAEYSRAYSRDVDDPGDNSYSNTENKAVDISFSTDTIQIPEVIHNDITVGTPTDSQAISAQADVTINGGTLASVSVSDTASGAVSPTSFTRTAYTVGASSSVVPITGLYLVDWSIENFMLGYSAVRADVLDASIFA